ncbi:MAG: YafY family transcriptional regulator [Sulfuricella sp.]|nr:YafY family transcriptional regulator [Sulfuricella sp.]
MDRTERFYRIDQLLNEYKVVTLHTFLAEMDVSRATFKRDLEYLRDRLNAPIVWDRDAGGYRFERADPLAPKYELPGLWFNASEIHALLTMQHLLENLGPGLLAGHVEPLLARLRMLLESADVPMASVEKRIRILRANARSYEPEHFSPIATGVLQRRRLTIDYYSRDRDETQERTVSPQRLTHYRDNWYLDAWCHWRDGLRSFALDAIGRVALRDEAAQDIGDAELDAVLGAGYGIFSGKVVQYAELRFSPERARWVSRESWHPQQESHFDAAGNYWLRVPYSDDRELLMDILRHGSHVEVLAPDALRQRVAAELQASMGKYA